ncbi:MAG: DNA replication/repair protein RecF [Clostridiales bacterium]|nr:DNA replication/repair protein RecF [Clostridiales bacterium]
MYIESLELKNYRNYEYLCMNFDCGTNILYGDNAQGKTNVLEAVYLAGTTKSHRGSKDKEMLRFGQEESHIRMTVKKDGVSHKIDMHLKKNKSKGIAIDGIPIRKASELFGIVNLVFFSPEDLNIIKNGPSERRRFLDLELCQLHKIYLQDLSDYNKILNQRNKLLKDIAFSPKLAETLDVWDMQLVSYGKKIIVLRKRFMEELNEIIREIHKNLTGGKEEIVLEYEPSVQEEAFEEQLARSREKDLRFRMSSVGPHRDDFGVKVNGIDIRKFGSQGQQRTAALSLKLSEIYLVKKIIKDDPVLLLDDVLSELDSNRQNYLLQSIHEIQTMITCTGLEEFIQNQFAINRVFRVIDGKISDC